MYHLRERSLFLFVKVFSLFVAVCCDPYNQKALGIHLVFYSGVIKGLGATVVI